PPRSAGRSSSRASPDSWQAVFIALVEYVSVSSQRDSEVAQLKTEKRELREDPERELAAIYEAKGLRPRLRGYEEGPTSMASASTAGGGPHWSRASVSRRGL